MGRFILKTWAFLKRDLIESASYKTSFVLEAGGILANTLSFFFIAKLVGPSASPYLSEYDGNYFSFVIIGIAFSGYLTASLTAYTESLSREQGMGTMEALLVTPTGIPTIVFSGALANFFFTTLRAAVYLALGAVFFGLDISRVNMFATIAALLLTITSLSGFGIISAGLTLMLKRGDPVNFIVGGFSRFLAGVYFPVALLPVAVQKVSLAIPLTYALSALRRSIMNGATVFDISRELLAMFVFSAVLIPLSILFFRFSVRRVMMEGSWAHC